MARQKMESKPSRGDGKVLIIYFYFVPLESRRFVLILPPIQRFRFRL